MPKTKSTSNDVFISYRREVSGFLAMALFKELGEHGIDAFYDFESIGAGHFDTFIFGQIAARPYFLLVLTPGTLERRKEADDWLHREIEEAVATKRVIILAYAPGFDIQGEFDRHLPGPLGQEVRRFQGLEMPQKWFKYAVQELVNKYLLPIDLPTAEVSPEDEATVERIRQRVQEAAPIFKREVDEVGDGADLSTPSTPGIFISFRREDSAYVRLLQSRLMERFPEARIFIDLDSIALGLDFAEVIRDALNSSSVLLALIGRRWATVTDEQGHRRLDNPDDFVRVEVQAALERGVPVIPVLVDGAAPPRRDELPSRLEKLARLQAWQLSDHRFAFDADRLVDVIGRLIEPRP
jgi:hypothetical protein